jgi:predicted kinase
MSEIVLCCGKVGSGKSTWARRLEAEYGFLLLSADEWMLRLNGEITDRAEFADKLSRCKALIDDLALDLLARGIDVVLDSGFWTRQERMEARALFAQAGHRVSLLHFALPDERQRANLAARNSGPAGFHYVFDEATVQQLNRLFETPDENEGALIPAEHSESLVRAAGQKPG